MSVSLSGLARSRVWASRGVEHSLHLGIGKGQIAEAGD